MLILTESKFSVKWNFGKTAKIIEILRYLSDNAVFQLVIIGGATNGILGNIEKLLKKNHIQSFLSAFWGQLNARKAWTFQHMSGNGISQKIDECVVKYVKNPEYEPKNKRSLA